MQKNEESNINNNGRTRNDGIIGAGEPDSIQLPASAGQRTRSSSGWRQRDDRRRRRRADVQQPCPALFCKRQDNRSERHDIHGGSHNGERHVQPHRGRTCFVGCVGTVYELRQDATHRRQQQPVGRVLGARYRRGGLFLVYAQRPLRRWHNGEVPDVAHRRLQLYRCRHRPRTQLLRPRARLVTLDCSKELRRTAEGIRRRVRPDADRHTDRCEQATCTYAAARVGYARRPYPLELPLLQPPGAWRGRFHLAELLARTGIQLPTRRRDGDKHHGGRKHTSGGILGGSRS